MLRGANLKETRIVRESARRAVNPSVSTKFNGHGGGGFVGVDGSYTVPITDGDDILDGHNFLTEVDETEDISALTS